MLVACARCVIRRYVSFVALCLSVVACCLNVMCSFRDGCRLMLLLAFRLVLLFVGWLLLCFVCGSLLCVAYCLQVFAAMCVLCLYVVCCLLSVARGVRCAVCCLFVGVC